MGKDDLSRVNYRFRVIAVRARIVSFLWQTGVIEVPTAPTHYLHSRFYTPFSTIPHLRHRRTPTRRVAGNGTVSAVDGSSITFPSRTPSSARVCPRFHRCAFKQVPSATFFKRFVASAHATDRAIHAHARVESIYYFSSSLSEILKTKRNEINAKLFQLFNLFDRSDLDTDRPISASLLYFGLFVNEIKRVCTCITGISWQSERMRV